MTNENTTFDVKSLIDTALAKAQDLCASYQYEPAKTFCRQILKIDDKNDTAWFLLGVASGCSGDRETAYTAFGQAAELTTIPENREHALRMKLSYEH